MSGMITIKVPVNTGFDLSLISSEASLSLDEAVTQDNGPHVVAFED